MGYDWQKSNMLNDKTLNRLYFSFMSNKSFPFLLVYYIVTFIFAYIP